MRRLAPFLLLMLGACAASTPETRISKRRALFDTYPAAVQEKIKAGDVETGFTEEMVLLALGKPDRRYTVSLDKGSVVVWAWTESRPGIGVGLGVGTTGGRYGVGTGISVGAGGGNVSERIRVSFQDGKVVSVERR